MTPSLRARLILTIVVLTLAAFWPSLHNGFTDWDDNRYLTGNSLVRDHSPAGILRMFSEPVTGEHHYHPLTFLSFALEYHFFELDPFVYHLDNLLLHLANSLLVFFFIWYLARSTPAAFLTAILFGVHPMHVESVAWIAERKDVLSTFFYLGALMWYVRPTNKHLSQSFTVLFLFLCALLSKPMAVTLPVILCFCDYYKNGQWSWRRIGEKWPFFALAVLFGLIAIAQKASAEMPYSVLERILFAGTALWIYLIKLVAPFDLTAFYDFPKKAGGAYPIEIYLAPVGFVLLMAVGWWRLRRNKDAVFGILFFLITIAPVLGLIRFGNYMMGERYTYLPYIGLFFMIARLLEPFIINVKTRRTTTAALGAFIVMCAVLTFQRCQVWKNAFTLWNDVLTKNPQLALAYSSRGAAYLSVGNADKALADFGQAIALDPADHTAYINRGILYSRLGLFDLAIADFTKAVTLGNNLEGVYLNRGVAYGHLKQWDQALADFDAVIRLKPDLASVYMNKGNIYLELGQPTQAAANYSKAVALDPKMGAAYYGRAIAEARLGNNDAASRDLSRAQALSK